MGQSWSFLHGQLTAYALAAGTAGVSVLALSVPAHAEIVYTSVHQSIGRNGTLLLDINHDGIIDFTLREAFVFSNGFAGGSTWNNKLYIIPAAGGGIAGGFYTLFGMVGELPGGAGSKPRSDGQDCKDSGVLTVPRPICAVAEPISIVTSTAVDMASSVG